MLTNINTNKKLIFVSLIALVIIVIFSVLLFIISFKKEKVNNVDTEKFEQKSTNFPLQQNELGYYSFVCKVNELSEINQPIQLNGLIAVAIDCTYNDLLLQPHQIKVPLIVKNKEDYYLASDRVYKTEFSLWNIQDYLDNISRFHYLEKVAESNKSRYDDPRISSYQRNNSLRKPIISEGDLISVNFIMENGLLTEKENLIDVFNFSKEYHEKITGYPVIKEFLESGQNPDLLFTEESNILIPSWVDFIEDKNL